MGLLRNHVHTMGKNAAMKLGGDDGRTPMLADGVTSIAAVVLVTARQNKWIMLNPLSEDEKQYVFKAPVPRKDPTKAKDCGVNSAMRSLK